MNNPDTVVLNKNNNKVFLINLACPNNNNLLDIHEEKQAKVNSVEVIPIMFHPQV